MFLQVQCRVWQFCGSFVDSLKPQSQLPGEDAVLRRTFPKKVLGCLYALAG
jgi:hypothetical protein